MKRIFLWASAVLLVITLTIVALYCGAVGSSEQAELNLIYRSIAFDVVGQYVQASGGSWPRSWEDLAATRTERDGRFLTSKELGELKDRVQIRFDIELKDVLLGGAEKFDAIRSKGYSYHEDNYAIRKFLENLKRFGDR